MTAERPAQVLDCLGRPCPVPVIELARALLAVPVGSVVEVLSDDPAAAVDIPAWCRMRAQGFEGSEPAGRGAAYRVRRLS
ncbi:MAG: sulfurtransferase TusA family protein [Mycobacteriales bacterium]